jgi:hypothetical protein
MQIDVMEQRANIKSCFKICEIVTENFQLISRLMATTFSVTHRFLNGMQNSQTVVNNLEDVDGIDFD